MVEHFRYLGGWCPTFATGDGAEHFTCWTFFETIDYFVLVEVEQPRAFKDTER
jgi:hypothetical protein